ncbi:GAF domain-containing protein, partial [Tepidiforma sp.]|uniref:GAF domain-containing protein n=1 Tax=Tepidiforma sp. TaxID=2682230 RepID=UPI002ADE22FE
MVEPALNGEPGGPDASLARALAAGGTFGVRFARFAEALAPAAGADLLAACWLDLEGQTVRVLATWPDQEGAGREFPIAPLELEQLAAGAGVGFAPGDLAGHPGADFLRELGMVQAWVAALSEDGQPVGVFVAGRVSERPFAAHEQEALREGAGLLAPAVAAERRLERARRAVERARVLNELAVLVNRGEGPEAFFAALSQHLREVLDFDGLGLWVTEGTEHFRVVGTLRGRTTRVGQVEPREAMGNLLNLLSGKGAVEAPIDVFSGRVVDRARAIGAKRGAAVALRSEGELVGLLLMSRMSDRPFDAEEIAHLETVGALVGQAIGNARKVEQRLAEAIRREALSELTALLQGEGTLEERFEVFSQTLLRAVGFDHISVTLCDAETGAWRPIRSHRLDIDDDPRFDPSGVEAVVRAGGVHQYRTAGNERRVPQALARAGFRRAATAAMTSAAGNEGLLTIGRVADERFSEDELAFIRVAAALLGQAVAAQRERVRERREAEDQAVLTAAAAAVARELDGFAIQLALTEVLRQVMPAPYVAFGFLDGGRVVFPNVAGAPGVAPLEGHFARALAEGQAVVGAPGERAPGEGREELEALGVQAYVVTAASSGGAPVGFLVIGSREPAFEPGERLQRLAQLIAD